VFIGNNFAKNMEIPGCKATLMNVEWGDAKELGFVDGKNYIKFNSPRDCYRKAISYLEQPDEVTTIAENGYNLVHSKHTNIIHSDNLFTELKRIYG